MAGIKSLHAEVSLRDVEPVVSFITDITRIRNDKETPMSVRSKIDAACSALFGGFARPGGVNQGLQEWRGWKIAKEDVPYPERSEWPIVCIVIPVFNSPALLKRCLVSLMRTDYPGELLHTVVDNASTDPETLEILQKRNFTPIRFDEPVGFARAVNAGMKQVPADYYVLFNQDCRVTDEQWLTNLINWMEQRPQCAIAGPKLLYPDGTIQHAGIDIPKDSCAVHRFLKAPADIPAANYYEKVQAVTGAVYAIRSSVLQDVGYLDEEYLFGCEDIEFCLRVATKAGKEVWYVPDSVVIHNDHGVRETNIKDRTRIREWAEQSDKSFRAKWGSFIDRCATESVAIVLPDYNPVAGGCRVVAALANRFITAGMETTVYVENTRSNGDDKDLSRLFEIKPLSDLEYVDILIATRFDTVEKTLNIPTGRKFYLVQQIETPMAKYCGATEEDVLRSYTHTEYEIITIGDHLAVQLAEMGRTSVVLDVGLYTDLYRYRYRRWRKGDQPFRVLMYATAADYKGGGDLSAIAAEIRKQLGDRVEVNSFHRDFPQPGWSDNHYQPQCAREVASIYGEHDCYVYASHSDGFAMTPVEAMSCGTPVILTDFPGKDQYARGYKNCIIVPFRDAQAIANAAVRLMQNPDEWFAFSRAGLETAKHYDWSRVGAQYVKHVLEAPV